MGADETGTAAPLILLPLPLDDEARKAAGPALLPEGLELEVAQRIQRAEVSWLKRWAER